MQKYAEYIEFIEIESLWQGGRHVRWHLDPQVNILSGINGAGKSTILRHMARGVKNVADPDTPGVHIKVQPADATVVRFDVIRTPDTRSEFDTTLSALQQAFAQYHDRERLAVFYDIIDELFAPTEKTVCRDEECVILSQYGQRLDTTRLSAGEKQMLIILITVLLQDGLPYVLFLDEPEMSLHFEWQKQLIGLILKLNPAVQIILTTHSPAIIMNGWMDRVTEVNDITV